MPGSFERRRSGAGQSAGRPLAGCGGGPAGTPRRPPGSPPPPPGWSFGQAARPAPGPRRRSRRPAPLPVSDAVEAGRPARPATLVDTGRDGVGDAAAAQQPPGRLVAVATVGPQVVGPLARSTASVWPGHPDGVQQRLELGRVVSLPGREHDRQGAALAVDGQVQLGGQPAPTMPQRLIMRVRGPLFGRRCSLPGGRRQRAGGHAPRCCRR
jgi:hypothetical protein